MPREMAAMKPTPPIRIGLACAALAIGSANGQSAPGPSTLDEAIEARDRGAIFESNDILSRAAPSAEVRMAQAINAYYLGRYAEARRAFADVLADAGAGEAIRRAALAWIARANARQIERMDIKAFRLDTALGAGSDDNANNALDARVVDDLDALPEVFEIVGPERQSDAYGFYRVTASHALRPAEPANLGGHPFIRQWTNSVTHYGRRFDAVETWNAQYTQLASTAQFERHMKWSARVSLSLLDYGLGGDPLVSYGAAAASYKRLLGPADIGVQVAVQSLDYKRTGWSARSGSRVRAQFFVERDISPRQSFRAGVEPQAFSADAEHFGYSGFRTHLAHAWRGESWRLYSRLIHESNEYDAVEPGYSDARTDNRFRASFSLVKPLRGRFDLAFTAQFMESDSNHKRRALSKRQLELSIRSRL